MAGPRIYLSTKPKLMMRTHSQLTHSAAAPDFHHPTNCSSQSPANPVTLSVTSPRQWGKVIVPRHPLPWSHIGPVQAQITLFGAVRGQIETSFAPVRQPCPPNFHFSLETKILYGLFSIVKLVSHASVGHGNSTSPAPTPSSPTVLLDQNSTVQPTAPPRVRPTP